MGRAGGRLGDLVSRYLPSSVLHGLELTALAGKRERAVFHFPTFHPDDTSSKFQTYIK